KKRVDNLPLDKIGPLYLQVEKFELARDAVADLDTADAGVKAFLEKVDFQERTAGAFKKMLLDATDAISKGHWDRAIRLLEEARKRADTAKAQRLLRQARAGKCLQEADRLCEKRSWEAAVAKIDEALGFAEEDAKFDLQERRNQICREGHDAYLQSARNAYRDTDLGTAKSAAKKAVALLPDSEDAKDLLEQVSLALDKPEGMVFVEGGDFTVGSKRKEENNPEKQVELKSFYIDHDEVSNREFLEFVQAGGYAKKELWDPEGWKLVGRFKTQAGSGSPSGPGPATWVGGRPKDLEMSLPVAGVSWFEARAYARFRGLRLPTAHEWEVAAGWSPRDRTRRTYPWGDKMDPKNAMAFGNLQSTGPWSAERPYRKDLSPLGCREMAGNVMEWTTWLEKKAETWALKGGSYRSSAPEFDARATTTRRPGNANVRRPFIGFRLARDAGR
ncbi:MAG: formylglycine-generating enzyme family protein, partial [Planctomycetota bacterium]